MDVMKLFESVSLFLVSAINRELFVFKFQNDLLICHRVDIFFLFRYDFHRSLFSLLDYM